jgi:hypothetical protein
MQMAKLDLNVEDEKKLVDTIFWSAMDSLSDDLGSSARRLGLDISTQAFSLPS